jgi:hypothetical protein
VRELKADGSLPASTKLLVPYWAKDLKVGFANIKVWKSQQYDRLVSTNPGFARPE